MVSALLAAFGCVRASVPASPAPVTDPGTPVELDGWRVVQAWDGVYHVAGASTAPIGPVTAYRWTDTRVFADGDPPAVPPPITVAPLEPVTLVPVGVVDGELQLRAEEDAEPLVTRLRAEPAELVVVGARQQVYKGFPLTCAEVERAPLPLDGLAAGAKPLGEGTCTRLPLDDGREVLATEVPVGKGGTCFASVVVDAGGGARRMSSGCRTIVARSGDARDAHAAEHVDELALDAASGPSVPEGWFRAGAGDVMLLVNAFVGLHDRRCLARLPAPGDPLALAGCGDGRGLGP